MDSISSEDSTTAPQPIPNDEQRVYLVPFRWWKEALDASTSDSKGVLYSASPSSSFVGPLKLLNNFFGADFMFNLRREDECSNDNGEVGVSGRDYALVSGDMWLQAFKWHSDHKNEMKRVGSFSAGYVDISDVYPIHLRLSALREANSLGVKISKKDNAAELFRRACRIFNTEAELLQIWDFSGRTSQFFVNNSNSPPMDIQRHSDQEDLSFRIALDFLLELVFELIAYGNGWNMELMSCT